MQYEVDVTSSSRCAQRSNEGMMGRSEREGTNETQPGSPIEDSTGSRIGIEHEGEGGGGHRSGTEGRGLQVTPSEYETNFSSLRGNIRRDPNRPHSWPMARKPREAGSWGRSRK